MKPCVLWADDDSQDTLASIGRSLEVMGTIEIRSVETLEAAVRALNEADSLDGIQHKIAAVLVDTMLPRGDGGSQKDNLGFEIARHAAVLGISRVVFLSVVPPLEVGERVRALDSEFVDTSFVYFSKLELFGKVQLADIVKALGFESRS